MCIYMYIYTHTVKCIYIIYLLFPLKLNVYIVLFLGSYDNVAMVILVHKSLTIVLVICFR